jgi:hypothetical protein
MHKEAEVYSKYQGRKMVAPEIAQSSSVKSTTVLIDRGTAIAVFLTFLLLGPSVRTT